MQKFEDIKQGQFIINSKLQMEGIVLGVVRNGRNVGAQMLPVITLLCTKDEVYKFNVGNKIKLTPCDGWEVAPNDREFR